MRILNKLHLVMLAIIIVVLVISGCSSSSNDSKTSTPNRVARDELAVVHQETSAREGKTDGGPVKYSQSEAAESSAMGETSGSIGDIGVGDSEGQGAFNQKLIYKANLTMEVSAYDDAVTELRTAIHQSGGYILQFQDGQYENEKGSTYTIKVPSAAFMSFVDRLDGIKHTRFERQLGATDVTEEYVDLESRLKAKQVVEERLLGFIDKAQKADDLVKFSQQLATVQEEIERIKGRVRYLDRNVAFSTIELRMYQPSTAALAIEDRTLGAKMSSALTGSYNGLMTFLQGLLIFLSGALPVLVFLAIIGGVVFGIYRRANKRRSSFYNGNGEKQDEGRNGSKNSPQAAAVESDPEPGSSAQEAPLEGRSVDKKDKS
ncbi:DUF4349 domain-containing protein [Paenibacillus radicis (ex Gao et al. 2016)]|uniref:DUF4349 domain-containing protein n=1 Tax=Paenibacillus radicis (ex Gao et al. 2016) TaxID=1737354 RepID=A0A917HSW1_9BACL|nr:DUF4349 domain-containing protein [Paenibacillus radicis (ex Gao et al. 2016)]GGG88959.1 hypothetical protein GCM10010918_54550 [Paenibacillus radicis (ex Gao et al. 2016)]